MPRRRLSTDSMCECDVGWQEDLDRYIGAGFTRVMLKPFSSATVGGVLRALFGAPTSPQVARPPGVV